MKMCGTAAPWLFLVLSLIIIPLFIPFPVTQKGIKNRHGTVEHGSDGFTQPSVIVGWKSEVRLRDIAGDQLDVLRIGRDAAVIARPPREDVSPIRAIITIILCPVKYQLTSTKKSRHIWQRRRRSIAATAVVLGKGTDCTQQNEYFNIMHNFLQWKLSRCSVEKQRQILFIVLK